MEYGKNKKRYVFYMTDDQHARFEIKLLEDNLKKTKFFKEFIDSYINGDPNIQAWMNESVSIQMSKPWRAKRKKELKMEALQKTNLNLDQKDISEIFDVLADEEENHE